MDFKFSHDHCSVSLVICSQSYSTVGQVYWLGFLSGWVYRKFSKLPEFSGLVFWIGRSKSSAQQFDKTKNILACPGRAVEWIAASKLSCPGRMVEWIAAIMAHRLWTQIRNKCQMNFLVRKGHNLGSGDRQSFLLKSLLEWWFGKLSCLSISGYLLMYHGYFYLIPSGRVPQIPLVIPLRQNQVSFRKHPAALVKLYVHLGLLF